MKIDKLFLIVIMISCLAYFSFADSGSFNIGNDGEALIETGLLESCGIINGSSISAYVIPYYIGLDEVQELSLYVLDVNGTKINDTDSMLQIGYADTWYNMTYSNVTDLWTSDLSSDVEEDIIFNLSLSSTIYSCINDTLEIKFREPFYIYLSMYSLNSTSSDTQLYENDFNYVYLERVASSNYSNLSSFIPSDNDVSNFFGSIYSFMPGIEHLYETNFDSRIVHWGKYSEGIAVIKLYEEGVYDINLLTYKLDTSAEWGFEFYKPQNSDIKLDSKVTQVNITSETDQVIKVLADKWEFDKMSIIINIVKTLFTVGIIIIMLLLLALLPGMSKVIGVAIPGIILIILKILGIL